MIARNTEDAVCQNDGARALCGTIPPVDGRGVSDRFFRPPASVKVATGPLKVNSGVALNGTPLAIRGASSTVAVVVTVLTVAYTVSASSVTTTFTR
jgi:hypothetical protein